MSEGDVSLIRDEDVLRRMWQQTEDFSRKKEIRTHMYKLREERLRNLYSPEPGAEGKGCEFSSTQDHIKSFADQSFQSMKSKEVRDAGSPPKEFSYRGQDLKELSNAGWNVESESKTTNDGHTHIKSMNANIEGQYDVDGGHGQFAAVDQNKQAVTEYDEGNRKFKRNENSSSSAAHEQVVRQLDDGSHFSSTTSSSTSTSKFEQISSKQEAVPYSITNDDYDRSSRKYYDDNKSEDKTLTRERAVKTTDYDHRIKTDYEQGDLVSRKVEYPDENTKVIVETRSLPDGTRVTSSRREFCAPVVQTSQSKESKSESKYSSHSSINKQSHSTQSSSKIIRETSDTNKNIVDSQRNIDEYDFKTPPRRQEDFTVFKRDGEEYFQNIDKNNQYIQRDVNDIYRNEIVSEKNNKNIENKKTEECYYTTSEEHTRNITTQNNVKNETVQNRSSTHQYDNMNQTDNTQRKISNDWSPAHQAWASTLRSDTPTGPSTRASSPGSRTFKSSNSSIRSSVSPDKTYKKPTSRGGSPSKIDRHSPTGTVSDQYSRTHSTYSTSETKSNRNTSIERNSPRTRSPSKSAYCPDDKTGDKHPRSSQSPEKRPRYYDRKQSPIPGKEPPSSNYSSLTKENIFKQSSDRTFSEKTTPVKPYPEALSPQRVNTANKSDKSPDRKYNSSTKPLDDTSFVEDKENTTTTTPGYMRPTQRTTVRSKDFDRTSPTKFETPQNISDEYREKKINKTKQDHYKFIDEETKIYTRSDLKKHSVISHDEATHALRSKSPSPTMSSSRPFSSPSRISPAKDLSGSVNKPTNTLDKGYKPLRPTSSSPTRKSPVKYISGHANGSKHSPIRDLKSPTRGTSPSKISTPSRGSSPQKTPKSSSPVSPDHTRKNDKKEQEFYTEPNQTNDGKHGISTYGTYEKTKNTVTSKISQHNEDAMTTKQDITDAITTANIKSRDYSPSKIGTYDIKRSPEKKLKDIDSVDNSYNINIVEHKRTDGSKPHLSRETSPNKPLSKTYPVRSPTKDKRFEHIEDFINIEKTTEEVNKTVTSKDRSRQLVTPSTSPTRKTKAPETEPSTGQSSPTTSVSGFIYFSSPRPENTVVTDLDTQDCYTIESTQVTSEDVIKSDNIRPSSPSKIPCKSPSPDKRPTKESLPRKSSLKKPSKDFGQISPTEKPPSHFLVSPNEERKNINFEIDDKTKDHNVKPSDSPVKSKPPFERRETYDERCRKILGMMEVDSTFTSENQTTTSRNVEAQNYRSPSISPCRSPRNDEDVDIKILKQDQIKISSIEKDKTIKTNKTFSRETSPTKTQDVNQYPSRESSPTKLQDITITTKSKTFSNKTPLRGPSPTKLQDITSVNTDEITIVKTSKTSSRETSPMKTQDIPTHTENKTDVRKTNKSPSRESSPTKLQDITITNKGKTQSNKTPSRETSPTKLQDITTVNRDTITSVKIRKPSSRETSPTKLKDIMTMDTNKIDSTKSKITSRETSPMKPHDINSGSNKNSQTIQHDTKTIKNVFDQDSTTTKTVTSKTNYEVNENTKTNTVKENITIETKLSRKPDQKVPFTLGKTPDKTVNIDNTKKTIGTKKETTKENKAVSDEFTNLIHTTEDLEQYSITDVVEENVIKPGSPLPSLSLDREPVPVMKTNKPKDVHNEIISTANEEIDISSQLITTERQQEVMDKVQKSLRKLSPDRKDRSHSPTKIVCKDEINIERVTDSPITADIISDDLSNKNKQTPSKTKDQISVSKPASRNVSPTKKPNVTSIPSRSISPKKPMSPTGRPQSPQVPKTGLHKPKEQVVPQGKRQGAVSPTKVDKTITAENKIKSTNTIKQASTTRVSTTKTSFSKISQSTVNKSAELEQKRALTNKNTIREVIKKESENKVTRTASDTTLKAKKPTPQRMKSKPEIHVNDIATSNKHTSVKNKPTKETQTKLPTSKPKSATALNTSIDEDNDFTIDVQQAKSSRENSPDRICPTPINFLEDVGTPRFPDEVSEPDDDFQKRTYKTIHESESLVDDIVEICEDEELFTKKSVDDTIENDECLLSVNDKVSKFTTDIKNIKKPKDTTPSHVKEINKLTQTIFNDNTLQQDECLLSVSQKVNKFATNSNRPSGLKDSKSPSRNITQEYDTQTTYQDDFTKLSVNDKANLFIETAENVNTPKTKPTQKIGRPDLSNVDEELKRDDCLLSVSDKVNKFVKTAEFLKETQEIEEKEQKIREQHDKVMKKIVSDIDTLDTSSNKGCEYADEEVPIQTKVNTVVPQQNTKPVDKSTSSKTTTLRSNDAVKKAKALFENIATTTKKTKEITQTKSTKSTNVLNQSPIGIRREPLKEKTNITEEPIEIDDIQLQKENLNEPDVEIKKELHHKTSLSVDTQHHLRPRSPVKSRPKSPNRQVPETITTTKTTITRITPAVSSSPAKEPNEKIADKPFDKVPSYQRPTKTSQLKEETKTVEETEVRSRRGSGKFGVELRRTSIERSTVSSERRRNSVEHYQPCIEEIFDLDLLEQMLEKVVGYEQRRCIRAQIRIARKKQETEKTETRVTKQTVTKVSKTKSPERRPLTRSPDRQNKTAPENNASPDRRTKSTPHKTLSPERPHKQKPDTFETAEPKEEKPQLNGETREPIKTDKLLRPQSPSKPAPKRVPTPSKSPVRPSSPDKRRPVSPTKSTTKQKSTRFNEYATAYMKKVGLDDNKKTPEMKTKKGTVTTEQRSQKIEIHKGIETKTAVTSKTTERTSSKDVIEIVQVNGKRSPSPEKKIQHVIRKSPSPDRKVHSPAPKAYSPERQNIAQRPQSPEIKRQPSDITKKQTQKETIIKTVYDIEKKIPQKPPQEEKPSWVTNRNLKKVSSETRTFSSKKIETEKPKFRAPSPSKVISKPIDVITSSYGPGPLDADGRPLFGIKALRNGATNYQVKGTVIRQEFHSRNGGEPQGTVSVTAYSTEPEDLEKLLQGQGEMPSKVHGLAAITTTKKFGGDTGTTYSEIHNKEERAALDQFTHSDRRVSDTSSITGSLDRRETQTHRTSLETHVDDKRRIKTDANKSTKETNRVQTESVNRKFKTESLDKKSERSEKRMEEKKTVRQNSVKSLTEKFIKNASETSKTERTTYPKAGLFLRSSVKEVSGDDSRAGLTRSDSDHSVDSMNDMVTTTTTTERSADGLRTTTTTQRSGQRTQERSFLDSTTKVTGVQDILSRMKNADIVIEEGDSSEDAEARALLNKFLGATVLMAGMQSYVAEQPQGKVVVRQETVKSSGGKVSSSRRVQQFDIEQCWDERVLSRLLDECTDYDQRRLLRARIRTVMAEQEACASAVTEALAAAGESVESEEQTGEREEEEVTTVTSSVRRNSSEKTVSSSTTVKNSKVIESMTRDAPKPVSPFAKFRQLEKQNSTNSPSHICGYK